VVPDENCGDGIDNDFDGLLDCLDEDCFGRTQCIDIPSFYIPNIIAINSATNNTLTIQSEEPINLRFINIYDRWGNQVYTESRSTEEVRWDGNFRGIVRTGVYIYHIQLDVDGTVIDRSGDITVVN